MHGILTKKFQNDYSVNGIGVKGSGLAQYLKFAKFAKEKIDPSIYIFFIIPNDYENSYIKYRNLKGFHYFDNNFDIIRMDYEVSLFKKILRESVLVRYLIKNLKAHVTFARYKKYLLKKSNIKENENENLKLKITYKLIDKFLEEVNLIVGNKPVLFFMEADRNKIYYEKQSWTNFQNLITDYFIDKSKSMGFKTSSLHNVFKNDYKKHQIVHNSKVDSHWNEQGHSVVANEIFAILNKNYIKN